jgi:hypothetical protein
VPFFEKKHEEQVTAKYPFELKHFLMNIALNTRQTKNFQHDTFVCDNQRFPITLLPIGELFVVFLFENGYDLLNAATIKMQPIIRGDLCRSTSGPHRRLSPAAGCLQKGMLDLALKRGVTTHGLCEIGEHALCRKGTGWSSNGGQKAQWYGDPGGRVQVRELFSDVGQVVGVFVEVHSSETSSTLKHALRSHCLCAVEVVLGLLDEHVLARACACIQKGPFLGVREQDGLASFHGSDIAAVNVPTRRSTTSSVSAPHNRPCI